MRHGTPTYRTVGQIICGLTELLQPAERISVSEAAEKYRNVYAPGSYIGPWRNQMTPYMVEPMDTFASRSHKGLIFVGPAQSGKTDALIINVIAYVVKVDPMDLMIVSPTMLAARDFSLRRIDRLHHRSPEIGAKLLKGASNDNVYDKHYQNGAMLTMSWPSASELAGKPIPRVLITDRDRMEDNVDNEGEVYDLASQRTTTFGSYAMTVCESSPSRPITDAKWIRRSPHEAPPCAGILALYNRGDRRRWYWPCPHCDQFFIGSFDQLTYDRQPGKTNLEIAETVRLVCPKCGALISPDARFDMNLRGRWLADGQGFDPEGRIIGPTPRTEIRSYWFNGVAAAFSTWKRLVATFLDAQDAFERTGSEEALTKFYNNDLGEPYKSRALESVRLPEVLKAQAEPLPERMVPDDVRFLIATIDVQQNQFVVSVHGILPGQPYDLVAIDHFSIRKSSRLDPDGDPYWVKPASYLDDWELLVEQVINREYPLGDGSGRTMRMLRVGCDSGGRAGVTSKCYDFYRSLRERGLHGRFTPIKGDPTPKIPRARITFPDASKKDQLSAARGDVPVLLLNSNVLKDDLDGRLGCREPGKGMYRTPDWFDDEYYVQMCSEVRDPKGWLKPTGVHNEVWDLAYYCLGLCASAELLRVHSIDWNNPPKWAAPWDQNDMIRLPGAAPRMTATPAATVDFAALGRQLA